MLASAPPLWGFLRPVNLVPFTFLVWHSEKYEDEKNLVKLWKEWSTPIPTLPRVQKKC